MFKRTFSRVASITADACRVPAEYEGCLLVREGIPGAVGNLGLTVIDVSPATGRVAITPALGNPVPLCWGWSSDGSLVIADSAPQVLEALTGRKVPLEEDLDEVAIVQSLIFDGPLCDRTLFKAVRKTQIGERLTFDLERGSHSREWVWLPCLQAIQSRSPSDISGHAKELIRKLADGIPPSCNEVVLPISGGLDSRLLAALAASRVENIVSYTFQRGNSYESYCGRRVARSLGARHQIYELGERCYRDAARKVVVKSGGLITGMHSHGIYCCEELLDAAHRKAPRIFGYFGDPVCGAMTQLKRSQVVGATPESLIESYAWCVFPELLARYRAEIHADVMQTWAAFKESGSPAHCFLEFWKIQQRQNNLINQLFHYHRAHHGVQVWLPFANREFADFFVSLPEEMRQDRMLFKSLARELFPGVFSLPSNHFTPESLMGRIERLFERAESLADKVSPRQTLVLSPFKYEHHDKNIVNLLSGDVERGMSVMSAIFGVKPVVPQLPLWKQAPAKDFYRIASLGYLVDGLST